MLRRASFIPCRSAPEEPLLQMQQNLLALLARDRLDVVKIGTELPRANDIRQHQRAGKHHYLETPWQMRLHPLEHVKPVLARHLQVDQEQVNFTTGARL